MSILTHVAALLLATAPTETKPAFTPPPFLPDPKSAVEAQAPDAVAAAESALALSAATEAAPVSLPPGLIDWSRVQFDEPGDGRVWARARTYKAGFGTEGATYIPFLGSRAPRNFPVHVGLVATNATNDDAELAVRDLVRRGNTVVLDRGAFREVWHLGLTSAEQTFEFDARPTSSGDFTVRLALETELALRIDGDGFALDGAHGGVRIGRATAIDADGQRLDLPARAEGREVAIELPASFLASARYPLVLDPIYTTAALEGFIEECHSPDVAGGDGTGGFAAVYSVIFSAGDCDVYTVNAPFGTPDFGSGVWVDTTSNSWITPRVAYNALNRTFLTVAAVRPASASSTETEVWCRARYAPTSSQWNQNFVHGGAGGADNEVTVGGDPSLIGPTNYLAVWARNFSLIQDSDIQARMIDSFGNPIGGTIYLESSGEYDRRPRVSKTNGRPPTPTQRWNVAWMRGVSAYDVWGAQLTWDGIVATPAFPISDSLLFNETFPAPSSPLDAASGPRPWLVVYDRFHPSSPVDLVARVMSGSTTLASANLSVLQGLDPAHDESAPECDTNGQRFVVSYLESGGPGGLDDSYLVTVAYAEGAIRVDEARVPVEAGPNYTSSVRVSGCMTTSNQGVEWYAVGWSDGAFGGEDAYCGAYYEPNPYEAFCFGDGSYGDCPCSNLGSGGGGCANSLTGGGVLTPTGFAFVSSDSFTLTTSNLPSSVPCLFFQGTSASTPGTSFGDGLRCASGSILRLASKMASGGVATYPELGDEPISVRGNVPTGGAQRYYQCWYRNAAAFCTSATFNTTNGVSVRWLL